MPTYVTELPLRSDLDDAHAQLTQRWAASGTWWSGAERLAIVAEVRTALDSPRLAPWDAPSQIEGMISTGHILPDPAIDAIWRLTNHPGTITAEWHAAIIGGGLHPEAYVELVAVVAQANAVDRFADALDLNRVSLPDPSPTEPPKHGAVPTAITSHWVPTAEIKGPNVLKALSAVPFENESLSLLSSAQYVRLGDLLSDLSSDQNSLSRMQVEVIAARTSKLNECFY